MADLTITVANVALGSSSGSERRVQFGETVTHGMGVYASSGKYYKADATSAAKSAAKGIVIIPNVTDGYGYILEDGDLIVGATLTVGTTYVVSRTSGKICPIADLTTGDYPTVLGPARTTTILPVRIDASGVAKP